MSKYSQPTEKQELVLNTVRDRKYWRPPTFQRIADIVKMEKKSVYRILKILEGKDLLERVDDYYHPREWAYDNRWDGTSNE
ncbi:hypothetical protein LCGC14_0615310 [marine sediment metagenome]|uniref:HTH iclR-type domain-containing protein n=1 Tax=marine sediment metagenome TaxID=412755 RepID=A0A0F9TSS7_9ZZZZ|nr:MarR family transcriptional regulator [Pricia sp.]HEC64638.1 MarR family transcriptional regulator [bacterium]